MPGWDVLLLDDMIPECAFTKAVEQATRAARLFPMTGRSERIAYMTLPASWDEWLKTLSGDRRYRTKNIRKKLHAAHKTRFFVWGDGATLDEGVDRLVALHTKRWTGTGQHHAFSTPEYVKCHRGVMHGCFAKDRLRLYCLEANGQIIAMYYFYKFRDRVYLMQSGFDPDFGNLKPGQVLLGHVIEHAIGEGNKVLDFLRGDHRYKEELATGERETVFVTAFRARPGALVYHTRKKILPAIKARVLELTGRAKAAAPATATPSE
jgi:CelD/BcsL family acetyltransferase involved in cellulose biosynthesis